MAEAKREGASRAEAKERLSRLDGVFVPGVSTGVTRRVLRRLEGAPYPDACLVPLTAGVHDRAWVEIMRGCTRGCRFCQAGMWYRPVRERSADEVLSMAETQLLASGHQELALASLSTTDYSCMSGCSGPNGASPSRGARLAALAAGGQRGGPACPPGVAHRSLADPGARSRQPADARHHQQERDRGRRAGRRRGGLRCRADHAEALFHDRAAAGDRRRRARHRRPVPGDPRTGPAHPGVHGRGGCSSTSA